jgi:hypothetical protein
MKPLGTRTRTRSYYGAFFIEVGDLMYGGITGLNFYYGLESMPNNKFIGSL